MWAKVLASNTQSEVLALLDRFLGHGMDYCKQGYRSHTGILLMYLPLYHILSEGRFTNLDINPS